MDAQECPTCDARTYTVATLDAVADPFIGKTLEGRYRIDGIIGRGGMGRVYRGTRVATGGAVAIKVIRAELASNLSAVKRFHREARSASMLSHPHTIRIFDFGQAESGELYMAMEYLSGRLLGSVIRSAGAMGTAETVKIAGEIAQSLAEAHAAGLAHRDLKPDNVMLVEAVGKRDFVKVLDFGIAKVLSTDSSDSVVTGTGAIVGTPHYMAPELATGERNITTAVDIYAFGVILFEMLSGRRPFEAETPLAVLLKHVSDPVPPLPAETIVPEELRGLLVRMLAKAPADRPTAEEVLATLGAIARGLAAGGGASEAPSPALASAHLRGGGAAGPSRAGTTNPSLTLEAAGPGEAGSTTSSDVAAAGVRRPRAPWAVAAVLGVAVVALLVWAAPWRSAREQPPGQAAPGAAPAAGGGEDPATPAEVQGGERASAVAPVAGAGALTAGSAAARPDAGAPAPGEAAAQARLAHPSGGTSAAGEPTQGTPGQTEPAHGEPGPGGPDAPGQATAGAGVSAGAGVEPGGAAGASSGSQAAAPAQGGVQAAPPASGRGMSPTKAARAPKTKKAQAAATAPPAAVAAPPAEPASQGTPYERLDDLEKGAPPAEPAGPAPAYERLNL